LLPALAKNMPLAYFLNASRPLHKGAFGALQYVGFLTRFRSTRGVDRGGICIGLCARQRRTLARLTSKNPGACPGFLHIFVLFLRLRAEKPCGAYVVAIAVYPLEQAFFDSLVFI